MAALYEPRTNLSRSVVSRYIQLATLFRKRIESGEWPAGSQIPTIEELIEECGVARATIRQAIGLLEAEGLVSRFRAKGTFVNVRESEPFWLEVTTDWDGMLKSRDGATLEVLKDELGGAPAVLPHPIGTVASTYRHLRRLHSRNGKRFLIADVFLDAKLAAKLPEESFQNVTAMKLAASIPGIRITDARQTLTISSADIEAADLLDLPLNAPVCQVDRSAVDQRGRLVLIAKGTYRGDVVRMEMRLK
jgi:GntR family transcriptional regulator